MKIKPFWNKEPTPLTSQQLLIERKLLPRLKYMGYLFFVLSLAALLFVICADPLSNAGIDPLNDPLLEISYPLGDEGSDQMNFHPLEVLNFYLVSLIFAGMGILCLYVANVKKKTLFVEVVEPFKEETQESASVDT